MKRIILDAVVEVLERELNRLHHANAQSNLGAAHSAPHAEKQRDTAGVEAAYLAHGYAMQCSALAKQIEELQRLEPEDFTGQEIDVGALVDVEVDGETECCLLLHCGGGSEVSFGGKRITVITPASPIGRALMGNVEAGFFSFRAGVEGLILKVC